VIAIPALAGDYSFRAKEMRFHPVTQDTFLLQEKQRLEPEACRFALSIDQACATKSDPPCENLVPIAFNFCTGEMLRQMQPRVISKAEALHFRQKFHYCTMESVRALVTNPLRIEQHCSETPQEEWMLEENSEPLVEEFLYR
jgi:hypothetical protein